MIFAPKTKKNMDEFIPGFECLTFSNKIIVSFSYYVFDKPFPILVKLFFQETEWDHYITSDSAHSVCEAGFLQSRKPHELGKWTNPVTDDDIKTCLRFTANTSAHAFHLCSKIAKEFDIEYDGETIEEVIDGHVILQIDMMVLSEYGKFAIESMYDDDLLEDYYESMQKPNGGFTHLYQIVDVYRALTISLMTNTAFTSPCLWSCMGDLAFYNDVSPEPVDDYVEFTFYARLFKTWFIRSRDQEYIEFR